MLHLAFTCAAGSLALAQQLLEAGIVAVLRENLASTGLLSGTPPAFALSNSSGDQVRIHMSFSLYISIRDGSNVTHSGT